ncbi:hypothetical protein [Aliarcobacter butzleri]|uniref:hypothetical protein n=1 Tax=Aliarcobacter butzleri TaxID=28197 RepID=UPI003AF4D109
MNSAKRLLDVLKEIQKSKDYYKACEVLFNCKDIFLQLYFYKYFLNDLKNIERILKDTGKYKENIHKSQINLIAKSISPNYIEEVNFNYNLSNNSDAYKRVKDKKISDLEPAIYFMELMETFIPDEVFYDKDIEALRIALKDIEKTNSPLDDIIADIDEAVLYYGYFGNNIIEDKFHRVLGNTLINLEKIKPYIKKYSKTFKIIISFFDFYKKIKEIKEEVPVLVEYVKKELLEDAADEIDAEILTEE